MNIGHRKRAIGLDGIGLDWIGLDEYKPKQKKKKKGKAKGEEEEVRGKNRFACGERGLRDRDSEEKTRRGRKKKKTRQSGAAKEAHDKDGIQHNKTELKQHHVYQNQQTQAFTSTVAKKSALETKVWRSSDSGNCVK